MYKEEKSTLYQARMSPKKMTIEKVFDKKRKLYRCSTPGECV